MSREYAPAHGSDDNRADVAATAAATAAIVASDIARIKEDIGEIKAALKEQGETYLSRVEFDPVKKLVYGLVGLILTAVVVALVGLVVKVV